MIVLLNLEFMKQVEIIASSEKKKQIQNKEERLGNNRMPIRGLRMERTGSKVSKRTLRYRKKKWEKTQMNMEENWYWTVKAPKQKWVSRPSVERQTIPKTTLMVVLQYTLVRQQTEPKHKGLRAEKCNELNGAEHPGSRMFWTGINWGSWGHKTYSWNNWEIREKFEQMRKTIDKKTNRNLQTRVSRKGDCLCPVQGHWNHYKQTNKTSWNGCNTTRGWVSSNV